MKALLLGSLAVALAQPAFAGSAPPAQSAAEKFGSTVHLNYTRMGGGARSGGGAGYRGGYHGGYYGHGYGYRYPYYGYGYGYGYPYAAAFAFGFGLPLAYSAGYYSGGYYPAYYNGYYGYQGYGGYPQRAYAHSSSTRRGSSRSSGSFVTGVQSALKHQGYYAGNVDGVFGPESQQALTAFQHANHLSETGLLDAPSLTALGIGLKSGKQTASATTNRSNVPAPRTPTTEGTFVPPPTEAPVQPPGISNETAPQPIEPPPIIQGTPTSAAPTQ